ncbi:lantibiotic dehydratase [Micromonospora echinospora]|uniref:lantibiotic dehydratase n=1 Tax=Micromonospora echinospora TaxID=1877 RepID=UPI0033E17824
MSGTPWRALPVLLVRSAGFPAAWLAELTTGATVAALSRRDGPDTIRDAYDEEVRQTSLAVIRRFHAEPGLRDAVQFANLGLWQTFAPWLDRRVRTVDGWRSQDRQRTDTLTMLLQRYCAKNDTTSHAGPITTAALHRERVGVAWRPAPLRRHTRLSRWAAERLQESLAGDDDRWWRPLVTPGCTVRDGELLLARYDFGTRRAEFADAVTVARYPLTSIEAEVLRWCDGTRSVTGICRSAAGDATPLPRAEVVAVLRSLAGRGALRTGPTLPYGAYDALPLIRRWAREVGDRDAERHLDAVESALAELATASDENGRAAAATAVTGAYTAATKGPATRAAGVTYGDRTVYHEDCDSEYGDLVLGRPFPGLVERDLAFVYDLYLVLPRIRLLAVRDMLHRWFCRVFGPGASVPVHDFVTAHLRDEAALAAGYDEVDALVAAKAQAMARLLVPAGCAAATHHLDDAAVAAARALVGRDVPAVCNPDLMVAADGVDALLRGDYLAVVGDLHAAEEGLSHSMFAPWVTAACPSGNLGERVAAAYRTLLGPDEDLADVTHRHRNKHYARVDLPCLDVEAADPSPRAVRHRVRLHELMVGAGPGGLRLHLPGSDRGLRLTSPPLYWQGVRTRNPFAAFSFPQRVDGVPLPLGDRPYLPRLVRGRVVLQRAMWGLPATEFHGRDWYAGFTAVQRLRARHRLPRHVYVTFPQETKPVYCDLDSPLLVRQVSRLARAAAGGRVVLSEMLPAPDRLWLTGSRGKVTAELRYAVFSAGGGASG